MESLIFFIAQAGTVISAFVAADLAKDSGNSWIKSIMGGLPTEIGGSIIDRTYELAKRKLKESFPRIIRDNRKTLFKSIRLSQINAVRDACNAYRDEIKGTNSEKHNLEYIKNVEAYLSSEEAKLTRGDYADTEVSVDEIRRLMSVEKLPNFQNDAGNATLQELPKHDILPTRFAEMIRSGWQANSVNHSLLERFDAHFNDELANPEVANVLFKKALGGMQFSLDEILEGQAAQTEEVKALRILLEQKADRLEVLGYRILRKNNEVQGFEFIGEQLNRFESKIDKVDSKIDQLLESDAALSPEERQAKKDAIIQDYLESQITGYPVGEIVGEVYPHDKFFVDRDTERQNLPNWLNGGEKIVVIKGVSGDGKTALMTEVLRAVAPGDAITHTQVKGILTFYFRDFSGKFLDVNLLDICRKADARLAKDDQTFGFALQYEEFRKSNPVDVPVQLIAHLCRALNALGEIWIVFDNFESALQNARIKDPEIEVFVQTAVRQNNLRILITSQVLPVIPNITNLRQCNIADLPENYAKDFLRQKGQALKENGTDCGLAEATDEQLDELFTKLLPSPITLISFIAYLETLCDMEGKVFTDVLADETLFVSFADFDADDKNKGARVLIRRQFEILSEVEQLILKALSIFPKAVEFPVLQAILPLTLEKQTTLSILKSNSLVRKGGKNLYELLPLPKEVIARQFEENEKNDHIAFNLKAAMFYRSIHKPVADCYTLEDFDTYFKEIEHCYQVGFYEQIVQIINEIMPQTTPLGMMKETLEKSLKIQDKLDNKIEAKAENHVNIGLSLFNLERLTEAIDEFNKAINIYTNLIEKQGRQDLGSYLAAAFVNKGVSLEKLERLNESINELDKAIEIFEDFVENQGRRELAKDLAAAFVNKSVSLYSLERFNEAIDELDKAIEIYRDLVEKQGRRELLNDLAVAFMNKGTALEKQGNSTGAVGMFNQAIELWGMILQSGFVHNLPNLIKGFRIRVGSLIKLKDWANLAVDAVTSLSLSVNFTQDENSSEHFKQQIGNEFALLLYQIKELGVDAQEKIFVIADEIGQQQEEPVPFGDILRQYVGQFED